MGRRPFPVERARKALTKWLLLNEVQPGRPAVTVAEGLAVLKAAGIDAHRATLVKYGLNQLIAAAAERQRSGGRLPLRDPDLLRVEAQLQTARKTIGELTERNRMLLGLVALADANAQRLGISHEEIFAPIPRTDRSASRAGRR